tara:strand:+ start:157 stop:1017 length:861 start_codon:yes stop_codon:yes gene_type:complete
MTIEIVRNVFELEAAIARRRMEPTNAAATVGIVPTMGSIHEAHEKLIFTARKHSDIVVATIFVNPKQFGTNEDFDTYPRDEEKDTSKLEAAGCHIVYIPSIENIYPSNFDLSITIPKLSSVLCGRFRKNHFQGVATIVAKLLVQSRADYGFFGEKDFQQLLIVKKLVNGLDIPCKIISISTVRDKEGLAISSRNRYLEKDKKLIANNLYKILCEASKNIVTGENIELVIDKARNNILESGFNKLDYLEIRSEKDLEEIKTYSNKKSRIFVAAYINDIRLIDNIAIE